jgi:hypothetical protein
MILRNALTQVRREPVHFFDLHTEQTQPVPSWQQPSRCNRPTPAVQKPWWKRFL